MVCPKQRHKIERDVPVRVGILVFFCPEQGDVLIPSAAPLYPHIGQVPLPPPPSTRCGIGFELTGCLTYPRFEIGGFKFGHLGCLPFSRKNRLVERGSNKWDASIKTLNGNFHGMYLFHFHGHRYRDEYKKKGLVEKANGTHIFRSDISIANF